MKDLVIESRQIVKREHDGAHDSNKWQSGVWCAFRKLDTDKKWGIKCYYSQWERDLCFDRQKLAAKFGLAPKVGPKLLVSTHRRKNRLYCFITEVVQTVREYCQTHPNYDWYDDEQYEQLRQNLQDKCNLDGNDMHGGNVGFIEDKMVCIDFSHMNNGEHDYEESHENCS